MSQNSCPECGASMEEGFIPDMTYGQVAQLSWHRGIPEGSTFLGLKNGVKIEPKELVCVTASRCTQCGLLKLYAQEPVE